MKKFLALLLALVLMLSLTGFTAGSKPAAAAENADGAAPDPYADLDPIKIRVLVTGLEDETGSIAVKNITDMITERSGGKITCELTYGASTIYNGEPEIFDMVRSGTCEIANFALTQCNAYAPEVDVTCWPYVFESKDHLMTFFQSEAGDALIGKIEDQAGIKHLFTTFGGCRVVTTEGIEVRKPEDLAGVKLRCMDSAIYVAGINAMGATAVPITWGETYFSLQTGVVDGHENAPSVILQNNIYEVQDTLSLTNHLYSLTSYFANGEWFDSLPEAYQDLILDCYAEGATTYADELDEMNTGFVEDLAENGMKIVDDVDIQAFVEVTKDAFMERYADEPDFIQLYEDIKSVL